MPHSWVAHTRSLLPKNPPEPPLRKGGILIGKNPFPVPPCEGGGFGGG